MLNLLILLTLPEPIRSQYRDRLRRRFPELTIELVDHHSKVGPYISAADALLTFAPMLSSQVLESATRLKWIQALGTGVDNLIDQPALRKDIIVTNVRGIHGAPVSEAALASMLALARDLPRSIRAQDERRWQRFPARLLHDKTVGIFGIGQIAEALAPKCKALGMHVVGVSSAPRNVAGFDRMHRREGLTRVVGDFDFFVLLTPLTPATRNSIDGAIFAAMKPTSYLQSRPRRSGR
jgi:phosphoglycerate dehydrogenase-like enzyme